MSNEMVVKGGSSAQRTMVYIEDPENHLNVSSSMHDSSGHWTYYHAALHGLQREDSRGSDSGRRSESRPALRVVRAAEPALVGAEGGGGGGGGDGGDSGDDGGGGDGDGEDDPANSPPHLLLPSAALCVAMLLLLSNPELLELLKSLVDHHGMAAGALRFFCAARSVDRRNWKSELAVYVLGGGLVARHVPQEIFGGGQEWWYFAAGYCWRDICRILSRKGQEILGPTVF